MAERRIGAVAPRTAGQIEDHRRGDDRHHVTRLGPHREATLPLVQPPHHAVGRGETERAAARQAHGIHRAHEVLGCEQIRLPRARRAATRIHRPDGALRRQHDRGAAQPPVVGAVVVADPDPPHVRDRVVASQVVRRHPLRLTR